MNTNELNTLINQINNALERIANGTPEDVSKTLKTVASLCNYQAKKIDRYIEKINVSNL
jgi:hypothetical protein